MIPETHRRHIAIVQELSKPGAPLDKDGPHATVNNPAWFRSNGTARPQRRAVHDRLQRIHVGRFPLARQEGRALVLAGPPGAGKGRVAEAVLGAAVDHYVTVDADEFKKLLLHEAVADGSYEAWITPHKVRELQDLGERFYPLELASLVHEESSRLAVAVREDLIATRTNIVIDTVLAHAPSALAMGKRLADAGYDVTVIDVEVPFEVSAQRIELRWHEAMLAAESARADALGGRWVPSTYARALFDTGHGRSRTQDVAAQLAEECAAVLRYERYFTSEAEHVEATRAQRAALPVMEVSKVRAQAGAALVSPRRDTAGARVQEMLDGLAAPSARSKPNESPATSRAVPEPRHSRRPDGMHR